MELHLYVTGYLTDLWLNETELISISRVKMEGNTLLLQLLAKTSQAVVLFCNKVLMLGFSLSSRFRAISLLMLLSSCLRQMEWKCLFAMRMRGCT